MAHLHRLAIRGGCAAAFLALAALTASTGARAETALGAIITHEQEPEPIGSSPFLTTTGEPRPASFGTASFVLNDAESALSMSATIFNIDVTGAQTPDTNDNLVSAHIHAPAVPGVNAGVRWGFFGTPDNDVNPDNLVVSPFANGVGGTFTSVWNQPEGNAGTTLTAELSNLLGGLSYINFHTVQFGGGEIRGQILHAAAIPEPGSAMLLAVGLPGLLALRRRKR